MAVVSMKQLLEAGVHFGHQTRRWNPKMARYIFTERNGIYIIDLQKTVKKLEEAYNFVRSVSESGQNILFVGTKKQAQEAIKEEASRCGGYYVNARWLGGMMTNFKTMRTRVDRLNQLKTMQADGTFDMLPKKEVIGLKKERDKLETNLGGIKEMRGLPGVMFIVDPSHENIAVEEARKLNIPIVTYWNAVDLIEDDNPLYCGRAGNMGDRPGNWAIQNADLILAVGTRISIRQVGYNWKTWARAAEVIMVDIDQAELKKPTLHVEMPVWADAKDFLTKLDKVAAAPVNAGGEWLATCQRWKRDYPAVLPRQWEENGETANVYAFVRYLSSRLPENSLTAVSNGACCVVGNQAYVIQKGSRMANNSAIASMGYGLPAAIGTCIGGGRRPTICLEGDGSIMMNLQELQTILTNKLPIKIFLINNNGYHSIRLTQNNLFKEHCKVGIGPESGDLSFPEFEKIAKAFGYPYYSAHSNAEMKQAVDTVLALDGPAFCEIFTDTKQVWEPKSSTKRLPDGTLVSPPLEDLAPFLPREELEKQMFIPLMPEV